MSTRTTIVTNCDNCGDIRITERMIHLEVEAVTDRIGLYVFTCPHCERVSSRHANTRTFSVLEAVGCPIVVAQLTEAEIEMFAHRLATTPTERMWRELA